MMNHYRQEQARRNAYTRGVLEAVHKQCVHSLEVLRMRGAARRARARDNVRDLYSRVAPWVTTNG